MAEYSIELGTLVKMGYPLALNDYPIFREDYREILNRKIIDHFYFREIGFETPDRFNHFLHMVMHENMPYFNQLYESEFLKFDPLSTDYFEEVSEDVTNNIKAGRRDNTRTQTETTGDRYTSLHSLDSSINVVGNVSDKGNINDTENITSKSTQTNDLTTQVNSSSQGDGTQDTTGSRTKYFSDMPQTAITNTTTVNPDGSVTYSTNGYATTMETESTAQHDVTHTEETGQSTSTNTGTIVTEGESDRTYGRTTTNTTDETNDRTQKDTQHEDTQRNILNNLSFLDNAVNSEATDETRKSKNARKGRSGVSPSSLIQEYRNTFLNIDKQVIASLENLFMGVF